MERVKVLFFNESLRKWHFEDVVRESRLSRERVNYFLRQLVNQRMISKTKPRRKMPYYTANIESEKFRFEKRIHGLEMLEKAGLFEHLASLKQIKTAIVFGSFARGDWSKSSDIDLFVYGATDEFEKGRFELKLKRDIQLFGYTDAQKMKKELDQQLIPNIINGFNVKGSLEPFKVGINAKG